MTRRVTLLASVVAVLCLTSLPALAQLAREAPKLDPIEIKLRFVDRATTTAPLETQTNQLDLGAQAEQMADALRAPPPDPVSARERKRLREMELTERLEQRRRGDD